MCKYYNTNDKIKYTIKRSLGIYILILMILALPLNLFAGTTGKLAGRVLDADTGEPVVGANVIIEGTYLGAAADVDGYYFINNITTNC